MKSKEGHAGEIRRRGGPVDVVANSYGEQVEFAHLERELRSAGEGFEPHRIGRLARVA